MSTKNTIELYEPFRGDLKNGNDLETLVKHDFFDFATTTAEKEKVKKLAASGGSLMYNAECSKIVRRDATFFHLLIALKQVSLDEILNADDIKTDMDTFFDALKNKNCGITLLPSGKKSPFGVNIPLPDGTTLLFLREA